VTRRAELASWRRPPTTSSFMCPPAHNLSTARSRTATTPASTWVLSDNHASPTDDNYIAPPWRRDSSAPCSTWSTFRGGRSLGRPRDVRWRLGQRVQHETPIASGSTASCAAPAPRPSPSERDASELAYRRMRFQRLVVQMMSKAGLSARWNDRGGRFDPLGGKNAKGPPRQRRAR
jgi:hypothetical protein